MASPEGRGGEEERDEGGGKEGEEEGKWEERSKKSELSTQMMLRSCSCVGHTQYPAIHTYIHTYVRTCSCTYGSSGVVKLQLNGTVQAMSKGVNELWGE